MGKIIYLKPKKTVRRLASVPTGGTSEARRILNIAKNQLLRFGTIEFDIAVYVCFFSGRRAEAFKALNNPHTFSRSEIETYLADAFERLKSSRITEKWQNEWKELCSINGLKKIGWIKLV